MKSLSIALLLCTLTLPAVSQIQTAKLMAPDSAQFQSFGTSVAIDDDWLVVGVRQDSQMASTAGAAYSYQRRGGSWNLAEKFFSSDIQQGDGFGSQVVMEGSTCVIGARIEDPNGVFAAGSAYVFERVGLNWIQAQKLVASPTIPNANFGWSIALDGDRLISSARSENSRGAVYVFERVAGVWTQTARLQASDVATFDFFGETVALRGNTALVGSGADAAGISDAGAVYVYEFNGIQWVESAKLHASDGQTLSGFGSTVAMTADAAVFGALFQNYPGLANSGKAYFFQHNGASWLETQGTQQHAPGIGLLFAGRVASNSDCALIGASRDPHNISGVGAAYVHRRQPSGWIESARFVANDALPGDVFGSFLAIDAFTVVVGVPARDDLCGNAPSTCDSGAVYVFEFCPDARQFGWCMSGAPCGNFDNNAGCKNSTGVGATLGAAGSSSVAFDELRFEARKLQPNKSALLFMGSGTGSAVLGDGLRVATSSTTGLFRYSVLQSNSEASALWTNVISHSQNFLPAGRIQPGSVWNFQVWYRDPAGPCSSGTNLTNALEVVFRP